MQKTQRKSLDTLDVIETQDQKRKTSVGNFLISIIFNKFITFLLLHDHCITGHYIDDKKYLIFSS
jgi:hypothetical protein